MKTGRYSRIIVTLLSLLTYGTCVMWAEDKTVTNGITIIIDGNISNGTIDVAAENIVAQSDGSHTVTLTVTPHGGYYITSQYIKVEKMGDFSATRNPSIADYLPVKGSIVVGNTERTKSAQFTFVVPSGNAGAYVTAEFQDAGGLVYIDKNTPFSDITESNGTYILTADVNASIFSNLYNNDFTGTLDGEFEGVLHTINMSGSNHALFNNINGGVVKNVLLENVNVTAGNADGDAGAICNVAKGSSRIYNCGILPTTIVRDGNGKITGFEGSSVAGTRNVGGFVGLLDEEARVINCFSYANITGGSVVGGIVGNNNVATTATNLKTMVMNCMFYGDITSGSTISPVYGGVNISNVSGGLNTFNYYRYESSYSSDNHITEGKYNSAIAVKEDYLVRFELYRNLLNSNKKLAAIYATGSADNADQMAKWVLETADRTVTSPMPYPILKKREYNKKYPSIINYDAEHAPKNEERNKGGLLGTLSVTISGVGSGAPEGASLTPTTITLKRTDKDFDHHNFNYDKVQLPYYNDYGTGNYTKNKVVTGWKITSITPSSGEGNATEGTFTSGDVWGGYNFADRKHYAKDLYANNGNRIFSQGAYFDVPYGVTAITIEPYWGNAAYIADDNYDVIYTDDGNANTAYGSENVTALGTQLTNNSKKVINGDEQTVYTNLATAIGTLKGSTIYDNALVLIGNRHLKDVPSNGGTAFTMMSIDLDHDNEPDYSLIYHHDSRKAVSPIRFDFLNVIGTAMAQKPQKPTGSNKNPKLYNVAIFNPKGWFEITNTCLIHFVQFEYDNGSKNSAPLILLGGAYDQFTSNHVATGTAWSSKTQYIHVGSNVYFKNFSNGCHGEVDQFTKHVPISATGGDYDGFYLSGIYRPGAPVQADDGECYISGGRFNEVAGAAQQQIKGNVQWLIYDADITDFYGGGLNAAKPITGDITTNIYNSHVTTFCGGPKFGDMEGVKTPTNADDDKTVTTNADGCTFTNFFGAGYGGTSYNTVSTKDGTPGLTANFGAWQTDYTDIKGIYSSTNSGIPTDFEYDSFVWSTGRPAGRFYVKYASFSLAQTNNVNSILKNCTIEENFYGGGNRGKVNGTATSSLENCNVAGDVFGAGYSVADATIDVRDGGFGSKVPRINLDTGLFEEGTLSGTTQYTWTQGSVTNGQSALGTNDEGQNVIYTTEDLTTLGQVSSVALTIKGNTTIGGSVFGGGAESATNGAINVKIENGTVTGNVYGGGDQGDVTGSPTVTISKGNDSYPTAITGSVFGGGNEASTIGNPSVSMTNGTVNYVYGGGLGSSAVVTGNTTVEISGGMVSNDVYGGGSQGEVTGTVSVSISGDDTHINDVYGGGALANTNTNVENYVVKAVATGTSVKGLYTESGGVYTEISDESTVASDGTTYYEKVINTSVNLAGGTVRDVYGGGLGRLASEGATAVAANVNGHVAVTVSGGKAHNVFGCNNENGTPKESVTVTINGTAATVVDGTTKTYALQGVYGGGNLAHYDPTTPGNYPTVTVNGCATSIKDVFGGGNAAAVPYTNVTINGGDIDCVFAGGNGESGTAANVGFKNSDDTPTNDSYGAGRTNATIAGGTINKVFGGCNSKGSVRESGTLSIHKSTASGACDMKIGEVYGGGNLANGNACSITIGCTGTLVAGENGHAAHPENIGTTLEGIGALYGGANKADVGTAEAASNITLNINSGIVANVFGGNNTSGKIYGTIEVNINKTSEACGWYVGNVFGGGNEAAYSGTPTVNIQNGKVSRNVYGGGNEAGVGGSKVDMTGGIVLGNVFGGCNTSGTVSGDTQVNVTGGTIGEGSITKDTDGKITDFSRTTKGNVHGGGYGKETYVAGSVEVNIGESSATSGPTIFGDVYGGGALGHVNGTKNATSGVFVPTDTPTTVMTTVNLYNGTIYGDAYGGGLGEKNGMNGATADVAAHVGGDINVNLNGAAFIIDYDTDDTNAKVVKSGRVFGSNNLCGSPNGNIKVTVEKTVAGNMISTSSKTTSLPEAYGKKLLDDPDYHSTYELAAVYGGGNLAPYIEVEPDNEAKNTWVVINGCGETSIETVYGGGNAAAVPESKVDINGTYEIGSVFGGGNGKDKYFNGSQWVTNPGANVGKTVAGVTVGSGNTTTWLYGGTVHEAYGASNEKGTITGSVFIDLGNVSSSDANYCKLVVGKVVGAGKNADVIGNIITILGCKPEEEIPIYYGGADNANVNGDVEVTITSGNYGKVFAGNNAGGAILGKIILNIEETGNCETPITIDELYLGGNEAAYSVYGYYKASDGKLYPIGKDGKDKDGTARKPVRWDSTTEQYVEISGTGNDTFTPYADPILNVISCTSIGQIFGGGYGEGAVMYANPTVNINMIPGSKATLIDLDGDGNPDNDATALGAIGNVYGGGNAADVIGNTTVNIGTETTISMNTEPAHLGEGKYTYNTETGKYDGVAVIGANITGNVFGAGKGSETDVTKAMVSGNSIIVMKGGSVKKSVYGGGELSQVAGNTDITVAGGTIGTPNEGSTVYGGATYGNVYGGGQGNTTTPDAGLIKGNTKITVQNTVVDENTTITPNILHNIYGGGAYGSVGTITRDANGATYVPGRTTNILNMPTAWARKSGNTGTDTGNTEIYINGGQIGTNGNENGMIFGSSRGDVSTPYGANAENPYGTDVDKNDRLAWVYDTKVVIGQSGNPDIRGSVYGSGENGHVFNNTDVQIHNGKVGIDDTGKITDLVTNIEYTGADYPKRGNVYGGGCGEDDYTVSGVKYFNPLAGIVLGDTKVTIDGGKVVHNVYGAGALGSVGGKTTIEISAGQVGDDGVGDGDVYGAARGKVGLTQENIAQVRETSVTISSTADVKASVYGGGEAGNVRENTAVSMTGGTVGENVYGGGNLGYVGTFTTSTNTGTGSTEYIFTDTEGNANTTANSDNKNTGVCTVTISGGKVGPDTPTETKPGNVFGAGKGSSETFECEPAMVYSTNVIISDGIVNGTVYGGGEVGRVENNTVVTIGTQGETDGSNKPDIKGNVFAAGKGLNTHGYSALVRGDSKVTVQGIAHVGHSVFGGGEIATVGRYVVVDNLPTTNTSGGDCIVEIKGNAHIAEDVYGAGKGVLPYEGYTSSETPWSKTSTGSTQYTDANRADYFKYITTLAIVSDTHVTVTGNATVGGSVYGGGQKGFVQTDTDVEIQGSCAIGTASTTTGGNVFGGGLGDASVAGYAEAGRVKGNTNLEVSGGNVYGNVYGGGSLGDVGTIVKSADYNYKWTNETNPSETYTYNNTGLCTVEINGGIIGVDNPTNASEHGNVFGAGKGKDDTYWCEKAMVYKTNVTINKGTVKGNVYGGGQIGRVENNAVVTIGPSSGDDVADIKGNVFGAGAGLNTHGYSALVRGNATVTVQGKAQVGQSVYGGGETASVGRFVVNTETSLPTEPLSGGTCTVTVNGEAAITGNVYGACKGITPDYANATIHWKNDNKSHNFDDEADYLKFLKTLALTSNTDVTIGGSATIGGDVYGGGQRGITLGYVEVDVTGGTITKDVYGGGALADTNTSNWDGSSLTAKYYEVTGLTVGTSVVTGLYTKNGDKYTAATGTAQSGIKYYRLTNTKVSLMGGKILGAAYGGGLGQKTGVDNATSDVEAMVYGDVLVDLNGTTTMSDGKATVNGVATTYAAGCVVNEIFGGNNVNGSPKGDVMVHVYATQNKNEEDIITKDAGNYDVTAVYGGGNQSAYVPATAYHPTNAPAGSKTQVIIEGCSTTSIENVYGGGNAAAVPETNVEIRSAFEIYNVFGGGNGYSATKNHTDPTAANYNPGADVGTLDKGTSTYGTGNANTLLIGGHIHEAYGGSNQEGKIMGNVNINTNPKDESEDGYCALNVEKLVGAGKNADVDGDLIMILGCKPTTKTPLVFAGADNADVNGNVELTITSGTFGQVFGGNNLGGVIKGHIKLNIEETGCNPIRIDSLYLGGNQAAYSIYGYYNKGTEENPDLQPRTAEMEAVGSSNPGYIAPVGNPSNTDGKHPFPYAQPVLNVISATSIGKVFGGGLGEGAVMHADPTVNINMIPGVFATQELGGPHKLGTIGDVYGGGNEAVVYGKTTVNVGTAETVTMTSVSDDATTTTVDESKPYVEGARIIGNIFGGGNQANIEGSTEVNIGTCTYTGEGFEGVSVNCLKNTAEHPDNEEKTGMVFGGGNAADVTGNTVVNFAGGYVENRIYGGGNLGSVGTFTKNTAGKPDSWTSGGKCTVTVSGGKLGKDNMKMPDDFGYVFGASRGEVRDTTVAEYADLRFKTYVKETEVVIKGDAFILGGVYGGSENGHVRGDTWVKIQGGQIGCGTGTTIPYDETKFIDPSDPQSPVTTTNALATCAAFPYDAETTGKPYDPFHGLADYDSKGGATATEANDGHTFYGNVFGGGSGFFPYAAGKWLRSAGLVEGNTRVDIEGGHILSNVYGGNEQTDVYGTCTINMSGGTIGVPRTKEQIQGHPVIGNLFGAGKGDKRVLFNTWTNVGNTSVNVTGGIVYGSVFGGGEDGHVLGNATTKIEQANEKTITIGSTGESTADGNVFGGGRGSETALTAGVVGGNVSLTIKSGKILGNVYGGGRLASVGTNFTDPNDTKYGQLQEGDTHGNITMNIDGGTIGIATSETGVNGNIYGGSKGVDGKFDLGVVRSTTINVTGGTAYASVYGGGELAQVVGTHTTDGKDLGTEINISGGTIGKSGKGGATWGNVYGGGKGNTTHVAAGLIKTNTFVKIRGTSESPVIHHNIYGGGAYGSVGDFKYDTNNYITGLNTDNTGKAYITILGGKIGKDGKENGMIFGSSRGDVGGIGEIHDKLAWVYDTEVTIGGGETTPQIVGSVYGGGENGHNYHDAVVNIHSGTIGIASGDPITSNNGTPDDISDDITYNGAEYPYRGNVYGGGCGTDKYYSDPSLITGTHTANDGEGDKYNPLAGIVYGNATVNIDGGTVVRNVYGAGAMGSVGKTVTTGGVSKTTGGVTTISISGGQVGVDGTAGDGNVFGAARGDTLATSNEFALVRKETSVSISGNASVKGNVYGGGELGCVGVYTMSTDMRTFTWKDTDGNNNTASNSNNTGICKVTVSGGTIGSGAVGTGHVFGAGKGKDDTFWCEKGIAYSTDVSVTDGTVKGNVYGGGEVGRVETDTKVQIGDGVGEEGGAAAPTITGSVIGGGAGVETHGYSALVRGNTTVNVEGNASVGHSVYGGGEIASVGKYGLDSQNMPSILQGGGYCYVTVKGHATITDDVFGAGEGVKSHFDNTNEDLSKRSRRMTLKSDWTSREGADRFEWNYLENESAYSTYLETLALATHPEVAIDGNASIGGSVFGGGELGLTKGSVIVNINGGKINEDVYGGGSLANSNTTSLVDLDGDGVTETIHPTTTVNLFGGLIGGDAYGGGLGRLAATGVTAIEAKVFGDVAVNLGKADRSSATAFDVNKYTEGTHAGIVKSGRVFGCNNLNGSPQGNVTVTVNKTVEGNTEKTASDDLKSEDASKHTYHVAAVYGGGNLAGKTVGGSTNVVINGCDVSIRSVYGGGNAAEVPATDVLVNGAYEIGEVFGGGNGKDDYTVDGGTTWTTNPGANVNGDTNTLLQGGLIHEAYGGSNEKGTIVGSVSINTADNRPADCSDCPLDVEKIVGAGKNADVNGDLIMILGCKPETKTPLVFGGADNANVNGNVELTITSGTFGQVFGGNNLGGVIRGHVILNIEETGCNPIKIDSLYLGGNQAAYSIYGYYNKGTEENPDLQPRTAAMEAVAKTDPNYIAPVGNPAEDNDHPFPYKQPVLNVVSCTSIGKVFGGGLGKGAVMHADPTVNINMIPGAFANDQTKGVPFVMNAMGLTSGDNPNKLGLIGDVYGGGNEADVIGNTTVNIGTATKVQLHESLQADGKTYQMSADKEVKGAYITGSVFGGGKGKADTFTCEKAMIGEDGDGVAHPDGGTNVTIGNGTVCGDVYGGGEIGRVEKNTVVTIGLETGTSAPVIKGNVFGAGKGLETHGYSALVRGNTTVTVQGDAKVRKSVYGGGQIASVARYQVAKTEAEAAEHGVKIDMPYALANSTSGNCKVTIRGNAEIGPEDEMQMTKAGGPDDTGYVFGAGKGVLPKVYDYESADDEHMPKRMIEKNGVNTWEYFDTEAKYFEFVQTLGLATNTDVTIGDRAFIKGAVYGGSENGIVQYNTDVKIQDDCQIGAGNGVNRRYNEGEWASESLAECPSWKYEAPYAPYDPYATYKNPADGKYYYNDTYTSYAEGGANIATDGHTYYGNVFGGGSGSIPYFDRFEGDGKSQYISTAGMVKGNTNVTITGGHILTNVYGGCEATNVLGTAKITMTGGTIGVPRTDAQIQAHPLTGYLFGAGKGDQRIFFNKETNVNDAIVIVEGGRIYGSVYGGGEDGHVLRNVAVTIGKADKTGPTIGTRGTSYYDGHVFGGGRGFGGEALTAGNVGGSVEVNIEGGETLGSVYGGGRMASVGYGLYLTTEEGYGVMRDDDKYDGSYPNPSTESASTFYNKGRGHIMMNIKGGTIGNENATGDGAKYSGNVFGGSMGRLELLDGTRSEIWPLMAQVKSTEVNVSGDNTTIWRNVYGGGELGTVRDDAKVTVSGGTIRRDVYGGGYGSEDKNYTIFSKNESGTNNTYAYTPMQFAGCVGKSTTVNVSGGYIRKSVYGGGEMASVGVIDYRAKETTSEPAADKVKIGPIDGKTYYYENIIKHGDADNGFALSWPYEFKYVNGFEGATHVNITGGRLGLKGSDEDATLTDNGDVYGAGKGLAGDYKDYLFCANVGSTDVKIAYTTTPDTYSDTGDCIAGAVYGGGEDGHVMGDTKLTISGGLINHSVYGAGSGKGKFKATLKKIGKEETYDANIYSITAGKVFGNSTVEMSGGYVVRNIYGGGNMGSVGKGNYAGGADDYSTAGYGETLTGNLWDGVSDNSKAFLNSGKCTVKITGGTIGYIDSSDPSNSMYPWNTTASLPYGNVFGGCRGESTPNISETPRYLYSPEFFVGYANETEVTIEGDNTKILGSVYGGGMDGHVRRDASVIINGGEIGLPYTDANKTLLQTEDINDIQWLARGNVYGSGSGIGTYKYDFDYDGKYTSTVTYGGSPTKEEDFSTSAGSVTRFTKVEIKGGNIYRNVYGGGSLSSIGAPNMGQTYHLYSKDDAGHSTEVGKQSLNEVIISGGQIGEATGVAVNYGGYAFGGSRGDASLDNSLFSTSMFTKVNIGGGKVLGSVFGGGEVGIVKGSVAVNVTGGEVAKDVYGGGALANTNTANWNPTGGTDGKGAWADGQVTDGKTTYTTTVNLLGGTVDDVFGGALGQRVGDVTGGTQDIEAFVYGDVNVNLNGLEASDYVAIHNSFVTPLDKDANNVTTSYRANDGCIVKGEVYGCNNINGTPKGHSKVHVFKTMARPDQAATADKTADGYDVAKVFGGGNNADYVPVDTKLATEVIIEGCDLTSIHQVYGGGNAAATPGTSVLVKGTKIIYEVFGGGNGEAEGTKAHVGKKTADDSDYDLGEGKAEVKLMAGNVTYVYGGSNTHGDIRGGSYVTNVTKDSSLGCCEKLNVKEIFAGGKNADMIGGAKIVMGCTNSEDWVEEIYAGAKAANVGGDVSLTLTSGKFGRVFGGNKDSGVLDGSITVNIEENAKCGIPLIIGELYGGGNKAAYSIYGYNADGTVKTSGENPKASPVVNVRAFTSIGNIFGGGYGSAAEMHGSPTININVVNNNRTTGSTISTAITKTFEEGTENEYSVTIPTHEDRKIGAINNVYGGGNAAKVWGDTNVNIGTEAKQKLVKLDDSGNPLYTDAEKTIPQTEEMDVVGADIRGNVYGGGNAAEVTGNTNVVIGKDGTTTTTP